MDNLITDRNLVLCAVYIPHENSKYAIANDSLVIQSKHNSYLICLMGDFNSRTCSADDFVTIEEEVDLNCGIELINDQLYSSKCQLDILGIDTKRQGQCSKPKR